MVHLALNFLILLNFKTIFVRFIKGPDDSRQINSDVLYTNHIPTYLKYIPRSILLRSRSSPTKSSFSSSSVGSSSSSSLMPIKNVTQYPKSLSLSSMLKLGAVVKDREKTKMVVKVSEFDIHKMLWAEPKEVKFLMDEVPFAKGGFRSVFHANCNGKKYVIKKFLPSTMEQANEINEFLKNKETCETLARKAVQMHILAMNFAQQLKSCLQSKASLKEFGETFSYNSATLGRLVESKEFVMIEEFIEGTFSKYINNDGSIVSNETDQVVHKAECLVHFSYEKSNQEMMLLDIQGSGYNLYDPEIATATGAFDNDGELRFCLGNLATEACSNFIQIHKCNLFCTLAGRKPFSNENYIKDIC